MRRVAIPTSVFLLIIVQLFLGCSGDDPVDVSVQTGTIVINADPDSLQADWTLSRPGGKTLKGIGDTTIVSLSIGEYSITWDSIPGWYRAPGEPHTRLLKPDSNLTFNCLYALDSAPTGTVIIDVVAVGLKAPWSIVTPKVRTVSGLGDAVFSSQAIGEYTLTWGAVEGWESPPELSVTAELLADSTLVFRGDYTNITVPTGTVAIEISPDGLEAPWSLEVPGPSVITGHGDSLMTLMTPGTYQVTFGDLEGWNAPSSNPVSVVLEGDARIILTGEYEEIIETGSISIDCVPDDLDISWTLRDRESQVAAGVGDSLLIDMPVGLYSVLWGEIPGWVSPAQNPAAAYLEADSTTVFIGEYVEIIWNVGVIVIDPEPDTLNAPWELVGPDNYSRFDRGQLSLSDMPVGIYTLNWSPVENWLMPDPMTLQLLPNDIITFHGVYTYNDPTKENVLINAETFWMGSDPEQVGRLDNETLHLVTLTRDFWLKTNEVTMGEYCELLQWAFDHHYVEVASSLAYDSMNGGSDLLVDMDDLMGRLFFVDGVFSCLEPDKPMVEVTWYGAAAYCDWLNVREAKPLSYNHVNWQVATGLSVYNLVGYRLPTEAEWEFACGLGSGWPFNTGYCLDSLTDANYNGGIPYLGGDCLDGPYLPDAVNVGSYNPNVLGLYDMHGNVWEWCWDGNVNYTSDPVVNPQGSTSSDAIIRGGAWVSPASECRTARRKAEERGRAYSYIGFRVARTD